DVAARQTPPGARPSRSVDAARRAPGRPQGQRAPPQGEMDGCSRQDPAYRSAKGRAPVWGPSYCARRLSGTTSTFSDQSTYIWVWPPPLWAIGGVPGADGID